MESKYANRAEAGRLLAQRLHRYADRPDVIILGLPRGGLPVAAEVADALNVPLDVFTVRKLGVPGHAELAMGAIATGGVRVLNDDVVNALGISDDIVDAVADREQQELDRRETLYRGNQSPQPVTGKTVILVDDGLATGSTMRAAIAALRRQKPGRIVVAVPVAAAETCYGFQDIVDEMVCAMTPEPFHAVGLWYEDFSQTTDQEVRSLLHRSSQKAAQHPTETQEPIMSTQEIPRENWRTFFDGFSRDHQGQPVIVELLSPETGPETSVKELPLLGISLDIEGTRANAIEISAGDPSQRYITHVVDAPSHVRLADDLAGRGPALQIESDAGPTTLVHFPSAMH